MLSISIGDAVRKHSYYWALTSDVTSTEWHCNGRTNSLLDEDFILDVLEVESVSKPLLKLADEVFNDSRLFLQSAECRLIQHDALHLVAVVHLAVANLGDFFKLKKGHRIEECLQVVEVDLCCSNALDVDQHRGKLLGNLDIEFVVTTGWFPSFSAPWSSGGVEDYIIWHVFIGGVDALATETLSIVEEFVMGFCTKEVIGREVLLVRIYYFVTVEISPNHTLKLSRCGTEWHRERVLLASPQAM